MKKIFDISSDEIKRILTLHEERTRNQYLPEFIFEDTILNEDKPDTDNGGKYDFIAKCKRQFPKTYSKTKTYDKNYLQKIAYNLIDASEYGNVKYIGDMLSRIKTCGDLIGVNYSIFLDKKETLLQLISPSFNDLSDKWNRYYVRPMREILSNTSKQIEKVRKEKELKKKKEEEEKKKKAQQSSTDPFSNSLLKTKQEHKIFRENSGNTFLTIPVGTDFQKTMYNDGTAAQFVITHNNTDYMGYFSCKDGKYYVTPYNDTSSTPVVFVPSRDHNLDNTLKQRLNCWGEFNAKKFGINCAGAKINGELNIKNGGFVVNQPSDGMRIIIPFTTGDDSIATSNDVTSTGVEGLTAKIKPNEQFFPNGGNIEFNVFGTPTSGGTATFTNLLGCTVNVPIGKTVKKVTTQTPGGGTGNGGKAKGVKPKVNQTVANTQKIQQTYLKSKPTGTITSQDINNLINKIG